MATDFLKTTAGAILSSAGRATVRALLASYLLYASAPAQALDLLSPIKGLLGGTDKLVVWQAPGQYVKVVDQDRLRDHRRPPKNDHPATLKPTDLAAVLASLRVRQPGGSSGAERAVPLFTTGEISLLSSKLADALARANPKEDVVFAVVDVHETIGIKDRRSTAGRAFVNQGNVSIIFGDVLQPAKSDDDSISHWAKPHRAGKRLEPVESSAGPVSAPGIRHVEAGGGLREDWVVIDVPEAVAAYKGPPMAATVREEIKQAPDETARLLTERRQMLEEMARMRKELQEKHEGASPAGGSAEGSVPAVTAAGESLEGKNQSAGSQGAPPEETIKATQIIPNSIEQRLTTLEALHSKKLITDAEYAAKRKAILDEL